MPKILLNNFYTIYSPADIFTQELIILSNFLNTLLTIIYVDSINSNHEYRTEDNTYNTYLTLPNSP